MSADERMYDLINKASEVLERQMEEAMAAKLEDIQAKIDAAQEKVGKKVDIRRASIYVGLCWREEGSIGISPFD